MFSKSKRFDYYPKPNVLADSPSECYRCLTKHKDTCLESSNHSRSKSSRNSSSSKSVTSLSNQLKIQNDLNKSTSFSQLENKNEMSRRLASKTFSLHRANGVSSVYDNIEFENQTNTATYTRRKKPTKTDTLIPKLPSNDSLTEISVNSSNSRNSSIYDEISDSVIDTPSSSPDEVIQTDLTRYLDSMEREIKTQRQKIENMRLELFSSSSDNFESSQDELNCDVSERLQKFIEMSRNCVKETLEFIRLCNKEHEEKLTVRPEEYKELVDFCSKLIKEISNKLDEKKAKKISWKKFKKFVKSAFKQRNKRRG